MSTATLEVLLGTREYNNDKEEEEEENDNSSFFFQHFTIYKMISRPLSNWIPTNLGGWVLPPFCRWKNGGFSKVIRFS